MHAPCSFIPQGQIIRVRAGLAPMDKRRPPVQHGSGRALTGGDLRGNSHLVQDKLGNSNATMRPRPWMCSIGTNRRAPILRASALSPQLCPDPVRLLRHMPLAPSSFEFANPCLGLGTTPRLTDQREEISPASRNTALAPGARCRARCAPGHPLDGPEKDRYLDL